MHNNVVKKKLGVGRSDGGPPWYPHLRSRCAAAGEGEKKKDAVARGLGCPKRLIEKRK